MGGNGVQHLLVKLLAKGRAFVSLKVDQWLEGFEGLDGSLETDFSRFEVVAACGLCHDGPNQVVSQNVSPDFFANKFGRFATQDIHLETDLDVSEIQFLTPPTSIETCQVFLGRFFRGEQCCDDDDLLGAKSGLFHFNARLSNFEIVRQILVGRPIE